MGRCGSGTRSPAHPVGDPLAGHDGPVRAVAVGRAGDRDVIVSGCDDQTVRVWDAVTGEPVGGPLTGHDGWVNAVAVGRAGDRDIIVSGSGEGRCGSGTRSPASRSATRWPATTTAVNAVAVGRAGDRDIIVSGADDRTILARRYRDRRHRVLRPAVRHRYSHRNHQ